MTVTGAARILGMFAPEDRAASFALPSGEVTQTNRAGLELAAVGPNLTRS